MIRVGSLLEAVGVRVVVVTGAGGGLGRAMARRLLGDGFHCVVVGRHEVSLVETVDLAGDVGGRVSVVVGDVRLEEDRKRVVACALDQPGVLYGLVNNAGVARMRPLLEETVEDWRDILETNLEAAFFLSQAMIEHMRRHRVGRIINIASMHGIVGLNNDGLGERAPEITPGDRGPVRESAYAASKGALIQMTRDLAAAVGRWGITVNAISPGNVPRIHTKPTHDTNTHTTTKTPQLGDTIPTHIQHAMARQTPLQRLGTAEEIAGPVSFLLSDDASYITGANLVVDGGYTIW